MSEGTTRRAVLRGGSALLATACHAETVLLTRYPGLPLRMALEPGVCLVRFDVEAFELLGREVVLLRSGALAVVLGERPPVAAIEVQPLHDLTGWTTVNHQVVLPARRDSEGRLDVDPYVNVDTEFGYTIHIPGALKWFRATEPPTRPAGMAVVRAVAEGPREICKRFDVCDEPAPVSSSVAVVIQGADGPPGHAAATLVSPELLALEIRPLPWVRVVVRLRHARSPESDFVWASTRHEFILSSPPAESPEADRPRDEVFVHSVRVPGRWGAEAVRLEATYLGWDVPDVSPAVLRDPVQWAALVDSLPPAQVRRADVPVSPSALEAVECDGGRIFG